MKTLTYKDGNLLLAKDLITIGHQANCQNTFGSGIARSIREMYPEAYAADTIANIKKTNVLGEFSFAKVTTKQDSSIKFIFNLYGQNLGTVAGNMFRKTNYEALYSALENMRAAIECNPEMSGGAVGFPYKMGSALGGGNWDVVSRLIEVTFSQYEGDVIIYKFEP